MYSCRQLLTRVLYAIARRYFDFGDIRSMQWADGASTFQPLPDGMGDRPCTGVSCCDHIRCSSRVNGSGAFKCGDGAYNQQLRAVFNASWAVSRLFPSPQLGSSHAGSKRQAVCTDESGPMYIPFKASADVIVAFLVAKVKELRVDGVCDDAHASSS